MSLLDKLRRARESQVTVGARVYTIRRPTDAEAATLAEASPLDLVQRFVIGWGLTEADLVPGGNPTPVPFDAALWAEWVVDQPEVWAPLATAVVEAYTRYRQAREDAEKN